MEWKCWYCMLWFSDKTPKLTLSNDNNSKWFYCSWLCLRNSADRAMAVGAPINGGI